MRSIKSVRSSQHPQTPAPSAETQRLAALHERKLAALEELRKSLLHQAFSGAL